MCSHFVAIDAGNAHAAASGDVGGMRGDGVWTDAAVVPALGPSLAPSSAAAGVGDGVRAVRAEIIRNGVPAAAGFAVESLPGADVFGTSYGDSSLLSDAAALLRATPCVVGDRNLVVVIVAPGARISHARVAEAVVGASLRGDGSRELTPIEARDAFGFGLQVRMSALWRAPRGCNTNLVVRACSGSHRWGIAVNGSYWSIPPSLIMRAALITACFALLLVLLGCSSRSKESMRWSLLAHRHVSLR